MPGSRCGLFLLIMTLVGCHQDDTAPASSDLLYRKWIMTEIHYKSGQTAPVSPTNEWAVTEFRSNGTILYGNDGKYYACCSPARFKRRGNMLDFVDVSSIPLPERTPNDMCILVDCVPQDTPWQIEELTTNKLVINQFYSTTVYQPYP